MVDFESYSYLTYEDIRTKIEALSTDYPDLIEATTSESELGIKHRVSCGDETCVVDIVRLTNRNASGPKKVIFISGAFHGNERLGPNASIYFLEYVIS